MKLPKRAGCPEYLILQLLLCVIYNLVFSLQQINLWDSRRKKYEGKKKHLWLQYNKNKPFVVTVADIYQPVCGCSFSLSLIQNIICHFVNTLQSKSLPASVSVWRINVLPCICLHFQGTAEHVLWILGEPGNDIFLCVFLHMALIWASPEFSYSCPSLQSV